MLLKSNLNQAKNGPALANIFPVLNKNITEENFNTSILVEDDICGFKNHPFSIENGNPFFAHFFFRTLGGGGNVEEGHAISQNVIGTILISRFQVSFNLILVGTRPTRSSFFSSSFSSS